MEEEWVWNWCDISNLMKSVVSWFLRSSTMKTTEDKSIESRTNSQTIEKNWIKNEFIVGFFILSISCRTKRLRNRENGRRMSLDLERYNQPCGEMWFVRTRSLVPLPEFGKPYSRTGGNLKKKNDLESWMSSQIVQNSLLDSSSQNCHRTFWWTRRIGRGMSLDLVW